MKNISEISHWEKSLYSSIVEVFILMVAGSATILWYGVKKHKIGAIFRDVSFSILDRLKRRDSQRLSSRNSL